MGSYDASTEGEGDGLGESVGWTDWVGDLVVGAGVTGAADGV